MELCHIVSRAAWTDAIAAGTYAPPSLAREGFVHLSTPAQVARTAARFFVDVPDLVVVRFAIDAVPALRWEPADGELFPHAYAPLDPARALAVEPLDAFLGG